MKSLSVCEKVVKEARERRANPRRGIVEEGSSIVKASSFFESEVEELFMYICLRR